MRRREVITLLGGAAVWPLAARAEQAAMPLIGFLNTASEHAYAPMVTAFREALGEAGYFDGGNVAIQFRWAQNRHGDLLAMARELVSARVAVIVATGNTDAALAARAATSTTPIVFVSGGDPVQIGLVASLNHPGGNVTGVTFLAGGLGPKKLEFLSAVVPTAKLIGVLINPTIATAKTQVAELQAAAQSLGLRLHVLNVSSERDFDLAFASLVETHAGGLVISADAFLNSWRDELVARAARHSIATVYPWREAVTAGGLMSYGANIADAYRQAGLYTSRILKGERPTDLPVQQAVRVDLVVNLKTAKTLGLTVPLPLLALADEVIE
jgi:putative tryptophan/tyrosine transport system substrate-binding protein